METTTLYTLASVLVVSLISIAGILLFSLHRNFTDKWLMPLVSLSAGTLLATVFLHMIPEMAEEATFQRSLILLLVGIIGSFIIEKLIHWRHCHHIHCHDHVHPMGLINIIGDAAHNFIDGTLIAGSFLVSPELGITTSIAVALHEIPQEIGDFAVLLYSGYSKKRALLMNMLAASTGILGAVLVLVTSSSVEGLGDILLPLAAGNFLYIAGVDLLPELHKETRLRGGLMQLTVLLLGMLLVYGLVTALPHVHVPDTHGEELHEEDHDEDHADTPDEHDLEAELHRHTVGV